MIVKDLKRSSDDPQAILSGQRDFETFCRGGALSRAQLSALCPSREDFALLYRFLRENGGYFQKTETLVGRLGYRIGCGKLRIMLEAMNELGLIEIREGLKTNQITLRPVKGKVNLENAQIIKRLRGVIK